LTKTKHILSFGATDQIKSAKYSENGIIRIIFLTISAMATAVSCTLTVEDDEGSTIWTDAGAPRAVNGSYLITGLTVPVDYNFSVKATLNDVAGAGGGTVTVKSYIEQV